MSFKNMNLPTLLLLTIMFLSLQEFGFLMIRGGGNQIDNLNKLINSPKSKNTPSWEPWPDLDVAVETLPPVYTRPQDGSMEANKIGILPGQPEGVDFDQYAGYVTVDPHFGKALFYYFVESPQNSSTKPLVLWLNGGPGCSSLGLGAMQELGPFRVQSDGRTLHRNNYSWNEVANVIFLESPAIVGFSYSNKTYKLNDNITAVESYTFLVNWFERFPRYKNRDFYITGESYAGHYGPQLAHTILAYNKKSSEHFINLKGIAIGNAYVDRIHNIKGKYDFFWAHAFISDETHAGIEKYCDYQTGNFSTSPCDKYLNQARQETGVLDVYNIYAPICNPRGSSGSTSAPKVEEFDACSSDYVYSYLNRDEVQQALHTRPNTHWHFCSVVEFGGISDTVLPLIKQLMATGIRIWLYSGDVDAVVSVTATRYSINSFNLPVETDWRAWYSKEEVGGYVIGYKGLVLVTIRGAGHQVPSYKPERALTMISSFLRGELPPKF